MENIILIFGLISVIVFGYFIMKRLDCFLVKNKKEITKNDHLNLIIVNNDEKGKIIAKINDAKVKNPDPKIILIDGENEQIIEPKEKK